MDASNLKEHVAAVRAELAKCTGAAREQKLRELERALSEAGELLRSTSTARWRSRRPTSTSRRW